MRMRPLDAQQANSLAMTQWPDAERTGKQRRGLRPNNLIAKRIVAAAESGKYKNIASIPRGIGVSRDKILIPW